MPHALSNRAHQWTFSQYFRGAAHLARLDFEMLAGDKCLYMLAHAYTHTHTQNTYSNRVYEIERYEKLKHAIHISNANAKPKSIWIINQLLFMGRIYRPTSGEYIIIFFTTNRAICVAMCKCNHIEMQCVYRASVFNPHMCVMLEFWLMVKDSICNSCICMDVVHTWSRIHLYFVVLLAWIH